MERMETTPLFCYKTFGGGRGKYHQPTSSLMFFGAWNIRGLNSSIKQREVRFFIQSNLLSFCVILETHLGVTKLPDIASSIFGNWLWNSNQVFCSHGVRILFGWNPLVLDIMIIGMTDQVINCKIYDKNSSTTFHASFVYASNNLVTRRLLWEELLRFSLITQNSPWVILGDFNATLNPDDSVGGCARRDMRMEEFVECVNALNVFDVRFHGSFYTWSQKPRSGLGIRKKLDRVRCLSDSTARFLPGGVSDHSAYVFLLDKGSRKRRPQFRLIIFYRVKEIFSRWWEQVWQIPVQGSYAYVLLQRMKKLKTQLRVYEVNDLKRNLLEGVQAQLDVNLNDVTLQQQLSSATIDFRKLCVMKICTLGKELRLVLYKSSLNDLIRTFSDFLKSMINKCQLQELVSSQ
ncbi:hypothetical protein OSB04_un001655, partial [Centaurea solstitialis]